MAIKRIKVSNFKSFKELNLELGAFNVVIGANASGKSNFVQIFKFIRDIGNLGLDNAISLQGSEYLTNIGLSPPQIPPHICFIYFILIVMLHISRCQYSYINHKGNALQFT